MKSIFFLKSCINKLFVVLLFNQSATALEVINFQNTLDSPNSAYQAVLDHSFSSLNYIAFVHAGTLIYDDYPHSTYNPDLNNSDEVFVADESSCSSDKPKLHIHPQNSASNCQNISLVTQRIEISHKDNTPFSLCTMRVGVNHLEKEILNIDLIGRKAGQEDQVKQMTFHSESTITGYYQKLYIRHSNESSSDALWTGGFTSIFISVNRNDSRPANLYFDDLVFADTCNL